MPRPTFLLATLVTAPAAAQSNPPPSERLPFELGQITVTAPRGDKLELTGSTLSAEAIRVFNRDRLDEAASLIPGVTASNTGGARNERLLFVRGFDRFQVPLLIDGIRVYLPADNRLDFGRFLTSDIAEVQVAKGYASVIDGPGAVGGLINLVTRRPVAPLEAEARATLSLDRDLDCSGYNLFGLLGTRQRHWYAQASFARNERDHFDLAGGFEPTPNENGNARDRSASEDWRVNAKLGFTPRDGDEYVLSYTRQEGSKNAPLETTFPLPVIRFWSWPFWDLESFAFFSTTELSGAAKLRLRAYHNRFDNLLRAFDDRSQTTQSLPRAFNSYYEDEAYGGSLRLEVAPARLQELELALFYRRDRHDEFQQLFPSGATEPRQTSEEDSWSVAGEHRALLSPELRLRVGASYDWRDLHRAEDYTGVPGTSSAQAIDYSRRNGDAWNAQGELSWAPARVPNCAPASRRARAFPPCSSVSPRVSAALPPLPVWARSAPRTSSWGSRTSSSACA